MPKIQKVVTTVWYNKQNMYKLRRVFPDAQFVYVNFYDKEKLTEEVKDADVAILMGDVDPCLLGENTLKWIHCDHAGLNGSARPEVFARGIPVTGAAGRSAPVLAEHCIYFMLQACYHTKELLKAQEECRWGVEGSNQWRGLYGRTAGIIGMGNNGKMLAERLRAFGMQIIAFDKFPIKGFDYIDEKYCASNGDSIQPLLEKSDFVILTVALTDETFHMINKDTLAMMKPEAFLINTSRGALIDEPALIEALQNGVIAGAGLDVQEVEPPAEDNPLYTMSNVLLTPHMGWKGLETRKRLVSILAGNIKAWEDKKPVNVVSA